MTTDTRSMDERLRAECDWPEDLAFKFLDEPGEHDPCYVVLPGGAMLSLAHHAKNGVDQARAKFIVDACNEKIAALRRTQSEGAVRTEGVDARLLKAMKTIVRPMLDGLSKTKSPKVSFEEWCAAMDKFDEVVATAEASTAPIDMVLYCPSCGYQHIDAPDERTSDWKNPPHNSHLCHHCNAIWRPCDFPTNGVAQIETRGKADTFVPGQLPFAAASLPQHAQSHVDAELMTAAKRLLIWFQGGLIGEDEQVFADIHAAIARAEHTSMQMEKEDAMAERVTKEKLLKAIRSFERADTEYKRACHSGEQPRLSNAGTRYAITKHRLFQATRPQPQEGEK